MKQKNVNKPVWTGEKIILAPEHMELSWSRTAGVLHAGIFPAGSVSLVVGLPGVGKTFSTVKSLNRDGIVPVLFDLDESEIGGDLAYISNSSAFLKEILSGRVELSFPNPEKKVMIIDTYERLVSLLFPTSENSIHPLGDLGVREYIENILSAYSKSSGASVIVIGHTQEYVGSQSIFSDNPTLARRAKEIVTILMDIRKGKGDGDKFQQVITYNAHIKKGRSSGGGRVIEDWERSAINLEDIDFGSVDYADYIDELDEYEGKWLSYKNLLIAMVDVFLPAFSIVPKNVGFKVSVSELERLPWKKFIKRERNGEESCELIEELWGKIYERPLDFDDSYIQIPEFSFISELNTSYGKDEHAISPFIFRSLASIQ